jgi:predicted RNA-binding protein (virulence factor B family)
MRRPTRTIVVPHADLVGRTTALRVRRLGPPGASLARDDDAPDAPTILLPKREVPADTKVGDEITVFVTLDSEDRPIATTRMPSVHLGEVAFLRITAITDVGVFVDWGLPKELLVPFREQTRDLKVGERHPVGLFIDKTGRLAGTMRVTEMLREKPVVRPGEWVAGEAWRVDPAVGLFVIVERRFVGLVPKSEPHALARGASAMFRVTRVRPDGKFELSLRAKAHEEIEDDAEHVLAILREPDAPPISEAATPDEIRARFGLSKKAFKRALGRLLKENTITIDTAARIKLRR